jgi:hypothetical protein
MPTAGLPPTTQFDYGERLLWIVRYRSLKHSSRPIADLPQNLARPVEDKAIFGRSAWQGRSVAAPALKRQDCSPGIAVDPALRLSLLVMPRDAVCAGVGAAHRPLSLFTFGGFQPLQSDALSAVAADLDTRPM